MSTHCLAPSQIGIRSRWALCLAVFGGCTLTTPITSSDPELLLKVPAKAASAPDATPRCDGGWTADCRQLGQAWATDYYGDLPSALVEADIQRRQWLSQAHETLQANATFNTLLWPLTGFGVYRATRPGPSGTRDALGVGLFGAMLYGLMSSGVPQRERQYVETARRLTCAMLRSSVYLYLNEEVIGPAALEPGTIDSSIQALGDALSQYGAQRRNLLDAIEVRQAAVESCVSTAACRSRKERGEGGSVRSTVDPVAVIEQRTAAAAATSRATLRSLRTVRTEIGRAGLRLRLETRQIAEVATSAIAASAPELAKPGNLTSTLSAVVQPPPATNDSADAANKDKSTGKAKGQGALADGDDGGKTLSTRAVRAQLTQRSAQRLETFQWYWGLPLERATSQADGWLDRASQKQASVNDDLTRLGCAAASTAAGAAASTSAATDKPATQATPKSGTPLPSD